MKCVICHGEDIQVRRVLEEFERGDDIVRVPFDVLVCLGCGERYYDRQAMRKIEEMRRRLMEETAALTEVGKVLIAQ